MFGWSVGGASGDLLHSCSPKCFYSTSFPFTGSEVQLWTVLACLLAVFWSVPPPPPPPSCRAPSVPIAPPSPPLRSDARWSAREYLDRWPQPLFPRYFDTLMHPFFASLLPLDADARVEAARRAFPLMRAQVGKRG